MTHSAIAELHYFREKEQSKMATHRRTRRRRRPKASARAYIIPTILLYSTVGGMHGGLTVPISVLAASEQTTYSATQETNDEAIETSTSTEKTPTKQGREMDDGADKTHQEQPPPVSSRTLQIRLGATSTAKSNGAAASVVSTENMTLGQILAKASKKGLGGGIPGFVAGVIQVITLMWLRTVVNYQSRYGTSFRETLLVLFNEGGVPRFYRGIAFALVQAPMARFVATFANDGCEALLASLPMTKHWGAARGTMISSAVVGLWRVLLMPIDTCKTVLQVESRDGFKKLMRKVRAGKISLLYQGALALVASSMMSYYPWFYSYRVLSKSDIVARAFAPGLMKNAFIGFSASVVSDVVANGIRVIKTTKQSIAASHRTVNYGEAISIVLAEDGWRGLFGRGLRTRIFGNALQSVLFTIVWRGLAERWSTTAEIPSESTSKESSTAAVQ